MWDYLVSVPKTEIVVRAALTEANQVLGSPLMVSTRRVEPTTSKATVLKMVSMLAKSRSEEEAKTRVSQTLEPFLEMREPKMAFFVTTLSFLGFLSYSFYRKTLTYEMNKIPLTLSDDRLHASPCAMACSFTVLNRGTSLSLLFL